MISHAEIQAAAQRIAPFVRVTPVMHVGMLQGVRVTLKLESLQHTGSFKARGAFNRVLRAREAGEVPASGLIAASGGNHGAAVAYVGQALGLRAEIFVPTISSPAKVARIKRYGAEVTQTGAGYADALAASEARRADTGAMTIHAYDMADVLAGQGTVATEFAAQAAQPLDAVLIAVGGGGLIGGMTAAFAGSGTEVIAVETEGTPTLHAARAANAPTDVAVSGLAADSLGARRIGALSFAITQQHIKQSVLVSDDDVKAAQRWLWHETQTVAEPGGATALAALLSGKAKLKPGAHVGVLVCGANCDPASVV
jgi:threonine dehydratase